MIIKLEREGTSLVTYVDLSKIYNITENNGIFELKQGSSTIASFAVANTIVSYSNGDEIIKLPQTVEAISEFILKG